MKRAFISLVAFIALSVGAALWWRGSARRRPMPCPPWLTGLLENPYVEMVAGKYLLLDRAGIGRGMRVLDAGCGPGRLTVPAAERVGPEGSVTALDLQAGMLAELGRRLDARGLANVRTILGGLGQGLLPPETFDRALLVTVLGEIPDPLSALREIYAALQPGGVLSLTEVLPDPHYKSQTTVRRLGTAAGFRVQQVYGNVLAYTINLVKPA